MRRSESRSYPSNVTAKEPDEIESVEREEIGHHLGQVSRGVAEAVGEEGKDEAANERRPPVPRQVVTQEIGRQPCQDEGEEKMQIVGRHLAEEQLQGQGSHLGIGSHPEHGMVGAVGIVEVAGLRRADAQIQQGFLRPPRDPQVLQSILVRRASQRRPQPEGHRIGHHDGDQRIGQDSPKDALPVVIQLLPPFRAQSRFLASPLSGEHLQKKSLVARYCPRGGEGDLDPLRAMINKCQTGPI